MQIVTPRSSAAVSSGRNGLMQLISHYYYEDRKITGQEARSVAEAWKDWRGLASFYLIMAERLKIVV